MSTPFVIGNVEREAIRAAVKYARAHPVPIDVVMRSVNMEKENTDTYAIEDRPPGYTGRPEPAQVMLPFGYRLAVSCEQQPAGMCLHLSMSAPDPVNRVPHPAACEMVLEAAGIDSETPTRQWLEEFMVDNKRSGKAWNCIAVIAPAEGGHA